MSKTEVFFVELYFIRVKETVNIKRRNSYLLWVVKNVMHANKQNRVR